MRLPPRPAPPDEIVFDEALLKEVFAYVSRRVRPREEAEDVAAETVQAALTQWHRLRGGDRRLWVLGIARRKTADALRRKSRRRETMLQEELPAPSRSWQDVEEAEATAQLRTVVLALPEDQREALLLQHLERLSLAEIAVVMGRSPAAVNGLLQRARARAFREGRAYFLEPEVPTMNDFERHLDDAFPAATLSDDLRERVAHLHPASRLFPFRPLLFLGAGLGVAALAAVLLLPRSASAAPLLAQATKGFVGHSRTFLIDAKGGRTLVSEGWYAPGRSRNEEFDFARRVRIENAKNGFEVLWTPSRGTVEILKRAWPVGGPEFPATLEPKALAEELRTTHRTPPPLEDAVLDGRRVKRADLRQGGHGVVIYGEPEGLRLIAYEIYERAWQGRGGLRRPARHELTYLEPGEPPESRFAPIVDLNGRRFDVFEERARVDKALATPLASYSVPGGTIDVRRVAMNRRGDLFVLFTGLAAGYGKDYLPTKVTDDAGGLYVKGIGFQPYGSRRGALPSFSFHGKPLEGFWYTRLGGRLPNHVSIDFRRQFLPEDQIAFRHVQPIKPEPFDVLDFQPFMSMGLASVEELDSGRAFALAEYYERKGDWAGMERWARRELPHSLAQEKAVGRQDDVMPHVQLAKALAMQGKRAEARREIAEARSRIGEGIGDWAKTTLDQLDRRLAR